MEVTINESQRLFVIKALYGYSTHGFDVVYNQCRELAKRIKKFGFLKPNEELSPVLESEIGTNAQYQQYGDFLAIIAGRKIGTWFSYDTPTAVRNVLEQYRKEGGKIRLFYGDRKTGRSWLSENDVLGRVGRSTGTLQIPLLVEGGENGGGGILDSCIIRIIDADTREELYRQKNFHVPEMEIRATDADLAKERLSHGVWVKNKEGVFENHANCKSFGKAAQWVAFMDGESTEQPC